MYLDKDLFKKAGEFYLGHHKHGWFTLGEYPRKYQIDYTGNMCIIALYEDIIKKEINNLGNWVEKVRHKKIHSWDMYFNSDSQIEVPDVIGNYLHNEIYKLLIE